MRATTEPRDAGVRTDPPFVVVPIAIGDYDDPRAHPSLAVEEEAREIGAIFERFGGDVRPWAVPSGRRDLTASMTRLQEWSEIEEPGRSVLLWLGHGGSNQDDAWLLVPGAGKDLEVNPETISKHIRDQRARRDRRQWAIVVVEACGASRFVALVGADLLRGRAAEGILLIGSGADQGNGYLATFRRALANVLEQRYTVNDAAISLGDLGLRLEEKLDSGYMLPLGLAGCALPPPVMRLLEPVTAPVDVYAELEQVLSSLPPHEQAHFAHKGMGTDLGELGWHFVSREQDRAAILHWLTEHDNGVLVLTGRAGSGKSAILGNLLLHARPEVREVLVGAGLSDDGWAESPDLPPVDAAIHLTGATVDDVVQRLAVVAGVAVPVAGSASQRAVALVGAVRESGRRLTVLADGLDEAQESALLAALVRELGTVPGVRMVIGTRASTGEGPDLPVPAEEPLLDELGQRFEHVTVQWVRRDPAALARYVERRLGRADGARRVVAEEHGEDFDEAVRVTARMIAANDPATGDGRQFLYASLAVHEILADPTLLTAGRSGEVARLLRQDHRALFDVAVRRLVGRREICRPVLEALAFAQGRGLPRAHRVWSTAASALADGAAGGPVLTDDDLQDVLDLAGPYVMLDTEAGQSVYRLAHRTFQEHVLSGQLGDVPARQEAVAAALLDLAARADADLNPYVARHLPGHLAAAGPDAWRAVDRHPEVLDRLDPHAVASGAMRTRGGLRRLPAGAIGTVASAHLIAAGTEADRRGLRELGAVRATGHQPTPAGDTDDPDVDGRGQAGAAWEVRWARLRRHPPHLTVAGHIGPVRAVAAFPGPHGSLQVASVGRGGDVWVWDAASGHLAGPAIERRTGPVTAAAVLSGAGGQHATAWLATAGGGDRVRIWDLRTGQQMAEFPPDRTAQQTAMTAFTSSDGAARLVTCDWDGAIRVWDPGAGRAVLQDLTGHVGPALAVTAFTVAGDTLLASAGSDGTIRVWDPETGRLVRRWKGHDGRVLALTTVRPADSAGGAEVLATSSDDGTIKLWDPATGEPVRSRAPGGERPILALAGFIGPDGAALLAGGGQDGTVQVWDPLEGRPACPALTGHSGPVRSLAAFTDTAGIMIASGGDDGTVRLWHLETADTAASAAARRDPVLALTATRAPAGPTVLAGRAKDGAVEVWDQATGQPRGATVAGEPDPAPALTGVTAPDGTVLVATTGPDRTVRVWDPLRGADHPTGPAQADRVWAVVAADGTPLVVTAGDGGVDLWRPGSTRRAGPRLAGDTGPVLTVAAFAGADGVTVLATGGEDGAIRIWDTATGRMVCPVIRAPSREVRSLAVLAGPGGRALLASAGRDAVVRVWDPRTGAPFGMPLVGHRDWVNAVAGLRDPDGGSLVASASDDQTVRVWRPATAQALHVLPLGMRCLSLAATGQDLSVGTSEGVLVLRLHPRNFTGTPGKGG